KDGNSIVTGDVDGKVVVWDTNLQEGCEAAERHGKMITALDVSSLHVASGSTDGTVRVWKMQEPGCPLVAGPLMRHGSIPVPSVEFSPAGNHIASVCAHWGCNVNIWHCRTGDQLASIGIGGSCTHSLAWSSDGQRLFAGCSDGSISCLDTATRKRFSRVVKPRPGDDFISSLRVSNGNRFLISFCAPGRVLDIWDISDTPTSRPIRSYRRCVSASISQDDLYLAISGEDKKISIQSLSGVVDPSYFFCFTYISPAAHRAWKIGELEQAEHILSREIENRSPASGAGIPTH
ncbi:WD40-repeat-containing domain protein, partial [Pisolithus albus]